MPKAGPSAPAKVQAVRQDVPLVPDPKGPSKAAGWLLVLPIAAGIALPFLLRDEPLWLWLALVACFLLFFVLFGWALSGHWFGIFLGRNNALSLSITQSVLWTSLILPAIVAAFANRLATNPVDALDIGFDSELALLMGIPVAGLAGARVINGGKANVTKPIRNEVSKQVSYAKAHLDALWQDYQGHHLQGGAIVGPMPPEAAREVPGLLRARLDERKAGKAVGAAAAAAQGAAAGFVELEPDEKALGLDSPKAFAAWVAEYLQHNRTGLVVRNLKPSEASLRDLTEGDEVGDEGKTDFGKAQFLVITLMALAAYASALAWMFAHPPEVCQGGDVPCITSLPSLSDAIPTALLTSLLGYLGFKAAPSTPTE